MMPKLRALAAALALALPLRVTAARADDASAGAHRAEAHRLASEGDDAFDAGRCDRAVELWKEAERHFHAPTILFRLATCAKLRGEVIEATRLLEQIVDEEPASGAPEAFAEVEREAARELPIVRARIATLEVAVDAPPGAPVEVRLDGAAVAPGAPLAVDPGEHRVAVRAEGASWEAPVSLGDGERRTVRVERPPPASAPPSPSGARIAGYVLGGVGLAAMAGGAVAFVAARSDAHALLGPCGPTRDRCPATPEVDDLRSRMRAESVAAAVLVGAGSLAFLGGAALLLASPPSYAAPGRLQIRPMGMGAQLAFVF